ncbi:pyridoxal-phosphate dependent enzyme [Candidatus Sumerlaeota bacterium]|nr:pyridoxal-phosphate dependent enzyme [Candidatus Sumerlaeota bacterium]
MKSTDQPPSPSQFEDLRQRLFEEIFQARLRVYAIGQPSPMERLELPGVNAEIWLKREDLSPIHAYKWRGAFNRMAKMSEEERARGVICASAGNHAQGVALAASHLGIDAEIVMPVSTPRMKQVAVERHGGDRARITLHGDNFDEALAEALRRCEAEGRVFIHPYDDLAIMGGQGTLADEVVMSGRGPFDVAYLQIGGGGLAAGVACWLRAHWPSIRLVGVEGVDQASMAAAVRVGKPVRLDDLDIFCDGTAVRRAGDLTTPLCAGLLDEFITVTNDEVCAAIQTLWEHCRLVPEPSGAMGLAGLLQGAERLSGERALVLVCGANMDFGRLAWIARHAGIGAHRRRYYRVGMDERRGSLIEFLEAHLEGINIIEFQYGKTDTERAWFTLGLEATPPAFELLERRFREHGVPWEEVTGQADAEFRVIRFIPALFHLPIFIRHEFPERPGALHDFLVPAAQMASICYFNYIFTGEEVGRALIGFEFESEEQRARFTAWLDTSGMRHSQIQPGALARIVRGD